MDSCLRGPFGPIGVRMVNTCEKQEPERRCEQTIPADSRRGPAPGPYPYRTATFEGDRRTIQGQSRRPSYRRRPPGHRPPAAAEHGFSVLGRMESAVMVGDCGSAANTGIRGARVAARGDHRHSQPRNGWARPMTRYRPFSRASPSTRIPGADRKKEGEKESGLHTPRGSHPTSSFFIRVRPSRRRK